MRLLEHKKIIVCCGSGGVGKTTIAAAIALEGALRGMRSIVLTIDPARRLATALGLDSLGNDPKEIKIPGSKGGGSLFALMLDTKKTFDRLIEKYTSTQEQKEMILGNRLYQHMTSLVAGSQEYMAMEKLNEIHQRGEYDLIVLDTPPTRHSLDFLEAPKKMMSLTSNSLLKWFLKPGLFAGRAGRAGWGALQKGAEKILSVFDRLAGFSFLHELAEMLSLVGNMLGGFHDRAQAVSDLLRNNFVGFLLVTTPSSVAIQDSLYFHGKIDEYRLPFSGFIINRVHERLPGGAEGSLSALPPSLSQKGISLLRNYDQLALRDQKAIALLKGMGGKKTAYATIPLLTSDVHDLEGLQEISRALFSSVL